MEDYADKMSVTEKSQIHQANTLDGCGILKEKQDHVEIVTDSCHGLTIGHVEAVKRMSSYADEKDRSSKIREPGEGHTSRSYRKYSRGHFLLRVMIMTMLFRCMTTAPASILINTEYICLTENGLERYTLYTEVCFEGKLYSRYFGHRQTQESRGWCGNENKGQCQSKSSFVFIIYGTVIAVVFVVLNGICCYCWKLRVRISLEKTGDERSSQRKFVIKNKKEIGTYAKVNSKNTTFIIYNQCTNAAASNGNDVDVENDINNDGNITDRMIEPELEYLKFGVQNETDVEQPATFVDSTDIVEADVQETHLKELC